MMNKTVDIRFDKEFSSFVRWKVKERSLVSSSTVLFTYKSNNGPLQSFKSSEFRGTVVTLAPLTAGDELHNGDFIMQVQLTVCEHTVVMKDMCAECGKDLRKKEGRPGEREVVSSANVAVVDSIPELMVTLDQAKHLGLQERKRLLESRRLVLLVDLDQTLIHTTNEDVNPNVKNVHHYQLYGPNSPWYHTRMRPSTDHFLRAISKLYQLHICTFGVRLYAHKVAQLLDADKTLFSHRILSRDECFDPHQKTGNLRALFPLGDQLVCIIDDREDVWSYAQNLVHVKPYRFFKHTGDINAPPGFTKTDENTEHQYQFPHPKSHEHVCVNGEATKDANGDSNCDACKDDKGKTTDAAQAASAETDSKAAQAEVLLKIDNQSPNIKNHKPVVIDEVEDEDDYLCYLEEILVRIHKAFYQMYDRLQIQEPGSIPDLKAVVPYVKKKILRGCNIVFSAVIPTTVDAKSTPIYRAAIAFGAQVTDHVISSAKDQNRATTHLIVAGWGTHKVKQALRLGRQVKILTAQWLWCCVERWERADERLFEVTRENAATIFPPPKGELVHEQRNVIDFPPRDDDADTNGSSVSSAEEANGGRTNFITSLSPLADASIAGQQEESNSRRDKDDVVASSSTNTDSHLESNGETDGICDTKATEPTEVDEDEPRFSDDQDEDDDDDGVSAYIPEVNLGTIDSVASCSESKRKLVDAEELDCAPSPSKRFSGDRFETIDICDSDKGEEDNYSIGSSVQILESDDASVANESPADAEIAELLEREFD